MLAVLLVTLAAPHSKATPVQQHINKARVEKSTTVAMANPTVTAKAPEPDNKTPVATVAAKASAQALKAETPPAKADVKTSAQQVAPPVYANGCSTYRSIFSEYGWNVDTAMAICQAESGGNPYAVSPTADYGLLQINQIHSDMVNGDLTSLFNPATNIRVAYQIYSANGWTSWTTFRTGAYLKYL